MKDIRIGNDILVTWSLFRGEEAYDLTNLPVTLYLKNAYGKKRVENYAVNGNQISWTFYGKDQKNTGKYSMVLVIREGEQGMASTDYCDFVQLVACACQVSGADDENVQTETLELNSEVDFPPIVVDTSLSEVSSNPIANMAVAKAFATQAESIKNKADKVEGLGLSEENYTTKDKEKLARLENYDDSGIKGELAKKVESEVVVDTESTEDFEFGYDDTKIRQEIAELSAEMQSADYDITSKPNIIIGSYTNSQVGSELVFFDYEPRARTQVIKKISKFFDIIGVDKIYDIVFVDKNNIVTRRGAGIRQFNDEEVALVITFENSSNPNGYSQLQVLQGTSLREYIDNSFCIFPNVSFVSGYKLNNDGTTTTTGMLGLRTTLDYTDVSNVQSLIVKLAAPDSPCAMICFYDNDYQFVSSIEFKDDKRATLHEVVVPNNGKYARFSGQADDEQWEASYVKMMLSANTIDEKLSKSENDISQISNKINTSLTDFFSEVVPTFEIGKYKSTGNKNIGEQVDLLLGSYATYNCGMVILNELVEKIYIKTIGRTTTIRPYVFLDKDGYILDYSNLSPTNNITEVNLQGNDIPRKARYLFVNFANNESELLAEPSVKVTFRQYQSLPLTGRRIICFGDSITAGAGNVKFGKLTSWVDYLHEFFGAEVTNAGVGGSHLTPSSLEPEFSQNGLYVYNLIKAWYTGDYSLVDSAIEWAHREDGNGDIWDHVPTILRTTTPKDYDVVIIAAGTNDWNNTGHVLGEFSDTDPIKNISASLKDIIIWLQKMNPSLQILICPPIVRYMGNINDNPLDATLFSDNLQNPKSNLYLEEVSETERAIAKKLHVQSLDMYNELEFNIHTWKTFATDNTHPNEAGYYSMACYIGSQLVARRCRY